MNQTGSLDMIRQMNSSTILNLLKSTAPMAKNDLAKATGLSAPTVTKIINDLIEIGIVQEVGVGESYGGRPPVLIDFRKDGGFVLGTNISNDHITAIMVDFTGEIIARLTTPVSLSDHSFSILSKVMNTISDVIKESQKSRDLIFGIGIGISGIVDSEQGVITQASRIDWKDVPIRSILQDAYAVPVYVEENTRLLSFAEKWFGAAQDYNDILFIRIGEELGACFMQNGKLFDGSNDYACRSIHKIMLTQPDQYCNGTAESLLTSRGICARAVSMLGSGTFASSLQNLPSFSTIDISEAASKGDSFSKMMMDQTAYYLAVFVSNICRIVDPEIVVLGGGLIKAGDQILVPFQQHFSHLTQCDFQRLPIVPSKLVDDAYAIGAAGIVLHNIFSAPKKFRKGHVQAE